MNPLEQARVYIVEDDPLFINLYQNEIAQDSTLKLLGSSQSGLTGLSFLKFNPIDVLICDLNLPDMKGIDVISAAKVMQPELQVLVITGVGDQSDFYQCLSLEVKGFIQKDEMKSNFRAILHNVSEGYAAISPRIANALIQKNQSNQQLKSHTKNPLSKRELEVLKEIASGLSIKEVARKFSLSPYTVSDHTKSIYRKLNVNSNTQAISEIKRMGWLN
jgi:DNA-binding NarL/FixJ family response regulator